MTAPNDPPATWTPSLPAERRLPPPSRSSWRRSWPIHRGLGGTEQVRRGSVYTRPPKVLRPGAPQVLRTAASGAHPCRRLERLATPRATLAGPTARSTSTTTKPWKLLGGAKDTFGFLPWSN